MSRHTTVPRLFFQSSFVIVRPGGGVGDGATKESLGAPDAYKHKFVAGALACWDFEALEWSWTYDLGQVDAMAWCGRLRRCRCRCSCCRRRPSFSPDYMYIHSHVQVDVSLERTYVAKLLERDFWVHR